MREKGLLEEYRRDKRKHMKSKAYPFGEEEFSDGFIGRKGIEFVEAYRARYDGFSLLRRGARVAIARGFSENLGAAIATELLESDIRPKTLPPRPLPASEAGADKDDDESGDGERR